MQEELLQFKLKEVWTLVDLPYGKRAIRSKWVFMNKLDKRGIVIRNKARLVAQGHIQAEGLCGVPDGCEECFSLGKEMCTEFEKMMHKKFQMSSIGLQVKQKEDGIFISQDKYLNKILTKFSFFDVKTASTPMETHKTLLKDEKGEDVDENLYRSMIGSLMYLTSLRHDIMFAVCACARLQVTPKISHLHAVKRIFKYLKGQPKLGL
uniref:Reverse transcriptase Ty1/copia-type domain-containing protein n=1 Tax=Tanacetum cinerariifolium TaxID=118510 RepID=A0A6L2KRE0_TANCI|nr:hypothetical protein [Tanacetum cinerariifolium]